MPQYCDSKALEANWFSWLLGSATPSLDLYRDLGLFLTKVLQTVSQDGITHYPNPAYPTQAHCLLTAAGTIYFNTYKSTISAPRYFVGSKPVTCSLPAVADCLDPDQNTIPAGYVVDRPVRRCWDAMLIDLHKICIGISHKFKLDSDEVREDLVSDALLQVANKIRLRKLVYVPGLAPVFNLLTTTIHRIMYSLLNKLTKEKSDRGKHCQLLMSALTPPTSTRRRRTEAKRTYGVPTY